MSGNTLDWERIGRELAAPFPPETVAWRAQSRRGNDGKARVVAYIDARDVQDRLDTVVGAGGWSFELEPLVVDGGELRVARGRLSIYGVSKDDVGTASNTDPSKGCASDALKRAAVQWGIGRYLYDVPAVRCEVDERGVISDAQRARLALALRRRAERAEQGERADHEQHSLRLADERAHEQERERMATR